ncbi:hypothetical protein [Jiangella alba]|uniref:hypothetical protein n=1 Tax=Jiangella alba TaxID=561176 RepID=UPI00114CF544|nr:hypothetical protein [Jiangella alba]
MAITASRLVQGATEARRPTRWWLGWIVVFAVAHLDFRPLALAEHRAHGQLLQLSGAGAGFVVAGRVEGLADRRRLRHRRWGDGRPRAGDRGRHTTDRHTPFEALEAA